ncbi:hypothetical protein F511_19879 [Dorcoceras hygrometricum]|uniref:Dystroglycan-like n=1 Tax=Dorcoceras hygrometricum TaxID=472368 RepID=A0A2Z7CW43_9LAMI|nr:hypothetical protein F511_19879 [Dorcoceras hygrometricum]
MAASLFVNTLHVCFESVLGMDNAEMVAMFESLVATGLTGFLGWPAVIHEDALLEFFANGSVRDELVVSNVNGVPVEISEKLLVETFELLVEGLTDLTDIPKDVVFDARSIFSLSGEPVSTSGKKRDMKIEFRLLCDILEKTISVKVGSFNSITMEKFLMLTAIVCGVRINWTSIVFNILKKMVTQGSKQAKGYAVQISLLLENVPNLELGESSEFPSSKILTERTIHRYIVLNEKVGAEEAADAPKVKKPPVKRAVSRKRPAVALLENVPNLELGESSEFPSSKILTERTIHRYIVLNEKVGAEEAADAPKVKKPPVKRAVSRKRPAVANADVPVVKRKRTTKSKSVSSKENLEMVAVAQETVPIQIIEPIPAALADDEVEEQPAVEVAAETSVQEPTAEHVDEQMDETTADEETTVENITEPAVAPTRGGNTHVC